MHERHQNSWIYAFLLYTFCPISHVHAKTVTYDVKNFKFNFVILSLVVPHQQRMVRDDDL